MSTMEASKVCGCVSSETAGGGYRKEAKRGTCPIQGVVRSKRYEIDQNAFFPLLLRISVLVFSTVYVCVLCVMIIVNCRWLDHFFFSSS